MRRTALIERDRLASREVRHRGRPRGQVVQAAAAEAERGARHRDPIGHCCGRLDGEHEGLVLLT
eukprot:7509041-Pyramimonas_sp.AAC.1